MEEQFWLVVIGCSLMTGVILFAYNRTVDRVLRNRKSDSTLDLERRYRSRNHIAHERNVMDAYHTDAAARRDERKQLAKSGEFSVTDPNGTVAKYLVIRADIDHQNTCE